MVDQPSAGGPDRVTALITVSASYGAGGSVIAPGVADRFGLPLLDRLVSADLVEGAEASGEGLSPGEEQATPSSRFFRYLAMSAPFGAAPAPPVLGLDDDDTLRDRAEAGITALREGGGGVVLGRAAAIVLAGAPGVFHVRLDGPADRRVTVAARLEGISVDDARRRLAETDRAREAYVRRLYRADPTSASHYHLVLDTTVLAIDDAVDIIVRTARAAWAAQGLPA